MMGSPTRQLVDFARNLTWDAVPEAVQAAATRAIADNVGCMIAGSVTDLARQAGRMAEAMGGAPRAVISGRASRTSAPLAAFLNSTHANALDYDDAFERDGKGMGHPGATVIPAALAVAEQVGASGGAFAAAVVAGYEVCNRIIEAIQPTPHRHADVWGVAVHQTFGAAVAAARLLHLDAVAFANAVGLAGTLSTVPAARKWNWTNRPLTSLKDVVAPAAEAGVKAALLAAAGWQGSRDILDGDKGFWIMAGSDRCDASCLTDGLSTRWTTQELSFKPYPACRWVHAALEATEVLMTEGTLTDGDIRHIAVGSFADVVTNFDDRRPATMIDGEFSLPWTVAVTVARVPKGALWYAPETLADPAIHAIVDRISLHVDDEAQARHFSDERKSMSVVRIETVDGRRLERRVAVARGGIASPWPPGALDEKFLGLAAPILGPRDARALQDMIANVGTAPRLDDIAWLIGAFKPAV
jgi:2-methylcitrate dehydratase PrpD